jgi:hypothetical protein
MVNSFRSDEEYLNWAERNKHNPKAYLINSDKNFSGEKYPMLHRASCRHATSPSRRNYTTGRPYLKWWTMSVKEAEDWAKSEAHKELTLCPHCKP